MKRRMFNLLLTTAFVFCAAMASMVRAEDIRVAAVLPASVKDLSWNTGAETGLNQLKAKYGIETSLTEQVADADVERVLRDYATQGYQLIISHSFNFQDACVRVAADFPDTNFANMSGFKNAPNVIACDWLGHESGYLAGVMAGLMTKTKRLGLLGGFASPDVVRIHEGFKLGAKEIDPDIQIFTTYVGSWKDSQKGLEAAMAMIENQADVILPVGDGMTVGAIRAAQQKGVKAIGAIGDLYPLAEDTVLTSVVYGIPHTIDVLYQRTKDGTFRDGPRVLALGLKDKGTHLADYRGNVPEDVVAKVEAYRQKILSGEIEVPQIDKPPEAGR